MATKKTMSFEAAMSRLEEISNALENGSEGLDGMLKLYGEGIELIRFCSEKLEAAEQKVRAVRINGNGEAETADLILNGGEGR